MGAWTLTVAGLSLLGSDMPVLGIAVSPDGDQAFRRSRVTELATDILALADNGILFDGSRVDISGQYCGSDYGVPDRSTLEAIELMARTEAIFLDPVYTGKAMAALIDLVRRGRFGPDETVVFLHTGGIPALFPYDGILRSLAPDGLLGRRLLALRAMATNAVAIEYRLDDAIIPQWQGPCRARRQPGRRALGRQR